MAVLASDSFNRANSTTGIGTTDSYNGGSAYTWASATTWGINSNQAYKTTGSASLNTGAWINVGVSDVVVSATFALIGNTPRLGFRRTDDNNCLFVLANGATNYQIVRRQTSTNTVLATISVAPAAGDVIEVTCNGSSITVKINGSNETTVTSTFNQTATQVGLITNDSVSRFDNFQVSDLSSGSPGVDGSISFDSKQVIYSDSAIIGDSKQIIYQDGAVVNDLKQLIYSDASISFDTKQVMYEVSSTLFDTLQTYFQDGEVGATAFDLRIQIYTDENKVFDTKQSIYSIGVNNFDLKQAIYEASQTTGDIKIVVYADENRRNDLKQVIYSDDLVAFDTRQTLFNPDKSIVRLVELTGNRRLFVEIIGRAAEPINIIGKTNVVLLKGGSDMTAENQDFTMYAGDTTPIVVDVANVDLSGVTAAKWGLREKQNSSENKVLKTLTDMTIEGTKLTIKLNREDTILLTGSFFHECEIVDGSGNYTTIFTGKAKIKYSGV